MARTRQGAKGRKDAHTSFAGIPRIVMEHPDYISLTGNAVKLLNCLAYQYRGRNNGDLTAAWGYVKNHGFKSQGTLHRATQELIDCRLIFKTREGRFLNPGGQCALYALSWQSVDECQGKRLELEPTITPLRKFSLERVLSKVPLQK